MAKRGFEIRKASGEDVEEMDPAQPTGRNQGGPSQTSDATPAAEGEIAAQMYLQAVEKAARERHMADPSRSYEQHYADALASPNGQRCYAMALR
jgi:hypothetical protein